MLFSSITFLYYFLPVVMVVYFIIPSRFLAVRNGWLLVASLFFYAWGEPVYVLLMAVLVVTGYFSGRAMEKVRSLNINEYSGKQKSWDKVFFFVAVLVQLGFLLYFKYTDFLGKSFSAIIGVSFSLSVPALPIGISFYTFQMLSYLTDVYRKAVPAQRSFLRLALYISMFPQLIAGPIVRYTGVVKQLENRTHNGENWALGARRFVLGLSKKVLLANVLGELCATFKDSGDKSVLFIWIYAVALSLQIYFDFSGYSDMAIGLGRIFGFHFEENFLYPYTSRSITEFWRRWHRTLGFWFRDYVYIPLGGSRVPKIRWFFNLFVVWVLTGLWHGAAWNFVLWGLFFGLLLMVEKHCFLKYLEKSRILAHGYVLVAVLVSFVIFDASRLAETAGYLAGMWGGGDWPLLSGEAVYYLKSYGIVLVIGMVGATPLCSRLVRRAESTITGKKIIHLLEPIILVLLLLITTAYLVDGSFNPFLYFRF
ncbi:MAG: MBOAT family protein [Lachnospiraceae bacterium]|nr:MBOAT family protein [Lachnospiraceae bacterium]